MDTKQFEQYIQEAILEVPKHIRKKIENVAFVIEDEARPAGLRERGINMLGTLLGLYQDIPLTRRSSGHTGVLPDKITIFQKPIEQLAGPDKNNICQLIHEVVHHEIAHYFGMNELKVRNWERKRKQKIS